MIIESPHNDGNESTVDMCEFTLRDSWDQDMDIDEEGAGQFDFSASISLQD